MPRINPSFMPQETPLKGDFVSIRRAAEILGVSVDTVRRWEKKGIITAQRSDGGHRLFSVIELERYKNNRPLTISEAAKQLNISTSTLRRYETQGKISPLRDDNGERLYTQTVLEAFLNPEKTTEQAIPLKEENISKEILPIETALQESNQKIKSLSKVEDDLVVFSPTYLATWQKQTSNNDPILANETVAQSKYQTKTYYSPFNENEVNQKYHRQIPATTAHHRLRLAPAVLSLFAIGILVTTSLHLMKLSGASFSNKLSYLNEWFGLEEEMIPTEETRLAYGDENNKNPRVLALTTEELDRFFEVNVPTLINDQMQVEGELTLQGNVTGEGIDINLGNGRIFASNVVNSVQGQTGDIQFQAGEGIEINGLTISNTAMGQDITPQNALQAIKVGTDTFTANSADEVLTVASEGATTVSLNKTTGTLTISSTDTAYTAGDDLELDGTEFSIASELNSVTAINGLTTIDATTENTIEAAIFDDDAETITGEWTIADDVALNLGSDADWSIEYGKDSNSRLVFQTENTSSSNVNIPMFEVLVGATPSANQALFGIAKGTPTSNTSVFEIDEDGDLTVGGTTTLNNLTYTWPAASGDNNFILATNGSGQLTWINPSAAGVTGDIRDVGTCDTGSCFTVDATGSDSLYFKGPSAGSYTINLSSADADANRNIVLPNASGTVILSGHNLIGDLTGTLSTSGSTSVSVAKINGATLGTTTASSGAVLVGNGSQWNSAVVSGDATISTSGALTIQADAIEESMLLASNSPSNGYCLIYNSSTGGFTWQDCNATGFQGFSITDGTTSEDIDSNDELTFVAGTGLATAVSATDTVTFSLEAGVPSSPSTSQLLAWDGTTQQTAWRTPDGSILQLSGTTLQIADDSLNFSKIADALTLDAPTTITAADANTLTIAKSGSGSALTITNTGTGSSLTVNDESGDSTPFIIDAAGNVTVGAQIKMSSNDSGNILVADGTGFSSVPVTGVLELSSAGVTSITDGSVSLSVDTSGNYVASITAGNGLNTISAPAHGSTPTLSVKAGNGISVTSSGVAVTAADSTLTVGSSGVAVTADGLDFSELKDALTLDASTDIAVTGSNVFSITNTGTGNSLVVNDESGDTTPFVIDAAGSVTFGSTTTLNGQTYTWPGDAGGEDYLLTTDGAGGLTWGNPGSMGLGDISAVGDCASGDCFTAAGSGTTLTVADNSTFYVKDASGHILFGAEYVSGANHVTLNSVEYEWPSTYGTSNQVLISNGDGTLNWSTATEAGLVGDVGSVGDCAGGDCFDGTSDGGTALTFYDDGGTGTLQISSSMSSNRTWTLPNSSGTIILSGQQLTGEVTTTTLGTTGSTSITIANDAIDLGTQTAGNYVASLSAADDSITVTGGSGEGATPTIAVNTGNGLDTSGGSLAIQLLTGVNDTETQTASGMALTANGLQLLGTCADDQILRWDDTNAVWACSSETEAPTYYGGTNITLDGTNHFNLDADLVGLTSISVGALNDVTTVNSTTVSTLEGALSVAGDVSGYLSNVTVNKIKNVTIGSATATAGNILIGDGSSWQTRGITGDISLTQAGLTTIQPNSVTLSTDTTGNYVATITPVSGTSRITVNNSGTEGAAITVDITADSLDFTELKDALALDAATTIGVTDTNTLTVGNSTTGTSLVAGADISVVNTGSEDSFTVNANGTEFVVDSAGDVTVGGDLMVATGQTTTLNSLTYTWPTTIGSNNYVLTAQTDGTLAWANITGGGIAGDINTVGDCTSGDCFDVTGNVTHGTTLYFSGTTPNLNIADGSQLSIKDPSGNILFAVEDDSGSNGKVYFNQYGYIWPDGRGSSGQVLVTDGAGNLTWQAVTGVGAGTGDVTKVGNCDTGDCFDGTSDGGSYLTFYDDGGTGQLAISASMSGNRTWTLPDADGTVILSGHTFTGDATGTLDTDGSTALTVAKINGATLGTTTATDANVLIADGDSWESVAMSGDITISNAGVTTIGANTVALGTDTTGDYVGSIADAGAGKITVTNGTGGEELAVTLDIAADSLGFSDLADSLTLDASTDIAVTGSNVFSITNTGTGNSLVVNDESGDTTPFVIDASGNITVGGTTTFGGGTYTWPTDDGTDGQVLTSDGSGTLTWESMAGDIAAVGDCTTGECFNGTSGTYLVFNDATGDGTLQIADLTAVAGRTWTLPDADGTIIVSGHTFTGDVTATLGANNTTALTIAADVVDGTELADAITLDSATLVFDDGTNTLLTLTDDGTTGSLSMTGGLTVEGTTTFNSLTYTWPSGPIGGNDYVLTTQTDGTLAWTDISNLASADIETVGTCESGACFTAADTSDYSLYFEGATADDYEIILVAADATLSDKTITLPNLSGTVALLGASGQTGDFTTSGLATLGSLVVDTSTLAVNASGYENKVGVGTATPEDLFEIQGAEGTDAVLVLDADDGDDTADTWFIKSLASTNGLSFVNGTTTVASLSSGGALTLNQVAVGSGNTGSSAASNLNSIFGTNNTDNVNNSGQRNSIVGYNNSFSGSTNSSRNSIFGSDNTISGAVQHTYNGVFGASNTLTATTGAFIFGRGITNAVDNSLMIGPSDAAKMTILSSGSLGIGDTSPDAKLEILSTTEQLRLTYTDDSVDSRFTVDSSGNLTIDNTGTKTTIADDLAISGDDLYMATNTAGYILVADGTNYNPVAMSGDVSLDGTGAVTIADEAVDESDLDISGSAVDGYCLKWSDTSGKMEWTDCSSAFSSFIISDDETVPTTQTIDDGETITFADTSTIDLAVAATNTVSASVMADSLDFSHLEDTLNLDNSTSMVLGAYDYDINLDSTGEFAIQDGGSDVVKVDADGKTTFYDDVDWSLGAGEDLSIAAIEAPTSDMVTITNASYGATSSADGLQINYTAASDSASGDTNMGINLAMTSSGDSGDTLYGVNIAGLAAGSDATEYALVIGANWDRGLYIQSASEFTEAVTYSGNARPTRQETLSPEYEGASLSGDGSSNSGTMTSDFCDNDATNGIPAVNTSYCGTSDTHSYYSWTTTESTSQDYDIWIRWRVPDNFDSWAASNPVQVYGRRTDATNGSVQVSFYDTNNAADAGITAAEAAGTASTWTQLSDTPTGTYTAGEYVTIQVHMTADQSDSVQVGEINLNYLSNN